MFHNHECSPAFIASDPSRRRLSASQRVELENLALAGASNSGIREHAFRNFGISLLWYDVRNLRRKACTFGRDLQTVVKKLQKHGRVLVHPHGGGKLSRISFTRDEQIAIFRKFPEVVGIDATYKTNSSKYVNSL